MVTVLHHPLVDHRMTYMRDVSTQPKLFRELVSEITIFLAYEALRDVKTEEVTVRTPLTKTVGHKVAENVVLVPVLRAAQDAWLQEDPVPESHLRARGNRKLRETSSGRARVHGRQG